MNEYVCDRHEQNTEYRSYILVFYIELGKQSSIYPLNASNAVQVMALETLLLNNGAATF